MMTEEWRAVVGWEGRYEVSDAGRVRSVDRVANFSDGRVRPYRGVVRKTYTDDFGYLKVTLKAPGVSERVHVHAMVASAWLGPRPPQLQVCHSDGDHQNNTAGNLRYDTPKGNVEDTRRHGRFRHKRKLDDAVVAAIREARGRLSAGELAVMFSTSKTHVCNLQLGRRRKD